MIAGYIARVTIEYFTRRMRKRIPNTQPSAARFPCSLYLIGSSGGTPYKRFRESSHRIDWLPKKENLGLKSIDPDLSSEPIRRLIYE